MTTLAERPAPELHTGGGERGRQVIRFEGLFERPLSADFIAGLSPPALTDAVPAPACSPST